MCPLGWVECGGLGCIFLFILDDHRGGDANFSDCNADGVLMNMYINRLFGKDGDKKAVLSV